MKKKRSKGLALCSLICGIIGLLLICIIVGIIPAAIGLVLSTFCLITKKSGRKMAFCGLASSVFTIIIFFAIMASFDADDPALPASSPTASTLSTPEETITYLTPEEMAALLASINASETAPESTTPEAFQATQPYSGQTVPIIPASSEPAAQPNPTIPIPATSNPAASAYPSSESAAGTTSVAASVSATLTVPSSTEPSIPEIATTPSNSTNNFDTYDNPEQQNTSATYVLNTNTMKIHFPDCSSVKKIAPQNYSTSSLTISELEAQGYSCCGICLK